MPETKEYSWTACNERHANLEKYNDLRFHQVEQEQCKMSEIVEKINQTLSKKFEDDAKVIRSILLAVLGTLATTVIGFVTSIILKIMHI